MNARKPSLSLSLNSSLVFSLCLLVLHINTFTLEIYIQIHLHIWATKVNLIKKIFWKNTHAILPNVLLIYRTKHTIMYATVFCSKPWIDLICVCTDILLIKSVACPQRVPTHCVRCKSRSHKPCQQNQRVIKVSNKYYVRVFQ
jgi:hypothetical protein